MASALANFFAALAVVPAAETTTNLLRVFYNGSTEIQLSKAEEYLDFTQKLLLEKEYLLTTQQKGNYGLALTKLRQHHLQQKSTSRTTMQRFFRTKDCRGIKQGAKKVKAKLKAFTDLAELERFHDQVQKEKLRHSAEGFLANQNLHPSRTTIYTAFPSAQTVDIQLPGAPLAEDPSTPRPPEIALTRQRTMSLSSIQTTDTYLSTNPFSDTYAIPLSMRHRNNSTVSHADSMLTVSTTPVPQDSLLSQEDPSTSRPEVTRTTVHVTPVRKRVCSGPERVDLSSKSDPKIMSRILRDA